MSTKRTDFITHFDPMLGPSSFNDRFFNENCIDLLMCEAILALFGMLFESMSASEIVPKSEKTI